MHILLDFDGTLVRHDKPSIHRELVKRHCGRADRMLASELATLDSFLNSFGLHDRTFVFQRFFPAAETQRLLRLYWKIFMARQKEISGARAALQKLQTAGHTLHCVTDTDGPGGNKGGRIRSSKLGLARYFREIFIGGEHGLPRKGTVEYFRTVLTKLGKTPAECVMVGDKVSIDLVPAQVAGITTILRKNKEYTGEAWPITIESPSELPRTVHRVISSTFLSYSHEDHAFVERLHRALEYRRIDVWRDVRLHPGQHMSVTIMDAIWRQAAFVVIVSPNSLRSRWVRREFEMAKFANAVGHKRLIAAIAPGASIPRFLKDDYCADFRRSFNTGLGSLIAALAHPS